MWRIGFLVWISCLATFICGNIFNTYIYCIRHLYSMSQNKDDSKCITKTRLAVNVILNLQQTVAKICLSWHDQVFESVAETNSVCNGLKKKQAISTDVWDQYIFTSILREFGAAFRRLSCFLEISLIVIYMFLCGYLLVRRQKD